MPTKISYLTWKNSDGSETIQYQGVCYILWPGDVLRISFITEWETSNGY